MRRTAIVPSHTVTWYRQGEHCTDSQAGDIILVRHHGTVPAMIRFGQRLRYWWVRQWARLRHDWLTVAEFDAGCCRVNHAMTVVQGGVHAVVEEQTGHGGRLSDLGDYVAEAYCLVHFTTSTLAQRASSVGAAKWAVGLAYGWVTIVALGLGCLLGGVPLTLGWSDGLICSADATLNARCQGLVPDRADLAVMPADLARWCGARYPF